MVAIDLIVQHVHSQLEEVRELTLNRPSHTHTVSQRIYNDSLYEDILVERHGPFILPGF